MAECTNIIACQQAGCMSYGFRSPVAFKKVSAFKSHIYRVHKKRDIEEVPTANSTLNDPYSEYSATLHQDLLNESGELARDPMMQADLDRLSETDIEKQKKSSALFILKMKDVRRISQVAVDDVVSGAQEIFDQTILRLRAGVRQKLAEIGMEENNVTYVEQVFDELSSPFQGLETSYKQNCFFKEELKIPQPQEIEVGSRYYTPQGSGIKRRYVLRKAKFYYVSIIKILQMLFQKTSFRRQLSHERVSEPGVYQDFKDGSIAKTHPVILENPEAIQIICYYDELEICNPLGSNVKTHKLGLVFFTIANIHPKFRSNFKGIFLSTVVNVSVVEEHGIDAVLQPIVDELKILGTNGITIRLNETVHTVKGALIAFLADNLASHTIGGFKESMSFAKRFCRTCLTDKEESYVYFLEEDLELRTSIDHKKQCLELQTDDSLSVEYGINRNSILNTIPGFSVVTGLPYDIMHDLLEGVVNYELRLLLKHCLFCKYFNIIPINEKIKNFDYGYAHSSTKPPEISSRCIHENMKIRYSASEMLTFVKVFPFMIGNKIPEDDEYYECFLKLLQILYICLAPVVNDEVIAYLRVLIEEHHDLFRKIYKNESFIPKMHFMVHYPNQILRHGPLVHSWTMRHEGKLNFFKQASRYCNFKNVSYSLSNHHQRWLAYHYYTDTLFTTDYTRGPIIQCNRCVDEDHIMVRLLASVIPDFSGEMLITRLKWIKVNSLHYAPNNAFLIVSVIDDKPIFAKIKEILLIGSSTLLLAVTMYSTVSYAHHTLSYTVTPEGTIMLYHINQLKHSQILHSYKLSYTEHIALPYYVLDF